MPQPKGATGNPNGRPKGTPNKTTAQLRETVHAFLAANSKVLQINFNKLEPKDKLLFFERLLKYALPQQQSLTTEFDKMKDEQLDMIIEELKKSIQNESEHEP